MSNGWIPLSVGVAGGAALAAGAGTLRILVASFSLPRKQSAPDERPIARESISGQQPVDVKLTEADGTVHHVEIRTEADARNALELILAQVSRNQSGEPGMS